MISKAVGITQMHFDLIQRVELAHKTFTDIVAVLRNPAIQVWTGEAPTGGNTRNAAHWIAFHVDERIRLSGLRDRVLPLLQRNYPELVTSAQGYVTTIPTVVAAIQAAIDRHGGRVEELTTGERTQLANAIEAQLEA